jgi:hypothetical protein
MAAQMPVMISAAVEGLVDEAVLRRLVYQAGGALTAVYGNRGKQHLRQHIDGYNRAARITPWVILMDLDDDADCAPPLRIAWLPQPARMMCLRVAVRAVEAWLLADQEEMARFLGVAASRIPLAPEAVMGPKRALVDIARHSRRRDVREDMVPRAGSARPVGPAYASRLIEFVQAHWRPEVAAQSSDSLRRCCERLSELIARAP